MPGHRNPFGMSGLLSHIEDAAVRIHNRSSSAAQKMGVDKAGAAVQTAADKARAFADIHGVPLKYVDLTIQFIGASGLPVMDVGGTADPYFHADVDGRKTFISSVQVGTLSPVWNEIWKLKNVPNHATLSVKVMDKDDGVITDDYIGKFETSLNAGAKELEITGPLFKRSRGTFWLKIDSTPSTDEDPAICAYQFDGPIRFSRHFSPTIGRLTNLNDERLYSTWKMTLRCVGRFFGNRTQHWNVNYAAAKRIFSDPGSIAVRSAIQAGHRLLYARSTTNGFGVITDPRDTLKLLHAGAVRGGDPVQGASTREQFAHRVKPAVYTYVIAADDDTFRFSETGAKFFVDFASKHALHANCAESVRYSGEFHPRPLGGWKTFTDETPDHQTKWELVIDNNSGTYAPDKTLLPTLQALLEYNFPGFTIIALDREDSALTESRESCREYAIKNRGILQQELQPHLGEGEVSLSHQTSQASQASSSLQATGAQGALAAPYT